MYFLNQSKKFFGLRGFFVVLSALLIQLISTNSCAERVRFEDQMERVVELVQPAQKVVAIPIPSAAMAISIDQKTDRLQGIHSSAKTAIQEGVLGKIFPQSLNLSTEAVGLGFMPNIENLLKLQPDLVFQWSTMGEDVIAPLKNAGLNVALMNYGQEEDVIRWFEMMGAAFDQSERVNRIIEWRQKVKSDISRTLSVLEDEKKPRALYFLRFLSQMRVSGTNSFNDYSISLAGGRNVVESGRFQEVNVEQVLVWDPEVILLNNFESELTPEDIYRHPVLSATSAAINKRVYKMPMGGARWDPPGQESPLMWMWLTKLLHPDAANYDLKAEIKRAYQLLYGYEMSEVEMAEVLHAQANKNSLGYEVWMQ